MDLQILESGLEIDGRGDRKLKCKIYYKDGTIFEGNCYYEASYYRDATKIIHREDGPAIEGNGTTKYWYQNGLLHREDGPAVEYVDRTNHWYLNGLLHRENGPAIEYINGTRGWWLRGKLHREDGPAKEYADGTKQWWLNNKRLKTLTKKYLIRYMELTGETLATLLLHPDEIIRDSVKKYKWNK